MEPCESVGTDAEPGRPMPLEPESVDARSEEEEWVRRCRAGDTTAYAPLVRRYQDRIFNVCWRMCGNRTDAEDLAQEAFVRALQAIGRFDARSRFYTWLFRIAVNLVISDRRKRTRARLGSSERDRANREAEGRPAADPQDRLASRDSPPDVRAADRERHARVLEALGALDEVHRTVVVLRDVESFGYDEIAEILEVPVGTVKSRLHRARLALREELTPLFGGG
ncbi:MAG: sigma-70 family RNA polymerase sigma factor [Phycisphaerae bacterium]